MHYADMESAAVDREKDTEALKAAMAQREALAVGGTASGSLFFLYSAACW